MLKKRILSNGMILVGLAAASVSAIGCVEDVGTLDRTRTDKVDKEIFDNDDEWWFRQTVISTDFQSSGGLFEGMASELKRVRWTITEDTLYAYSTVEPAVGITGQGGAKDPKERRLGVVAAFPISGHFDVQRGYNSSTGQVNNVISENSSDRLWFDRRYMRVDWDSNQIDGVGLWSRNVGRISSRKRSVPQSDSSKDYNRARIQKDYIDTVTEYYLQPDVYSCYKTFGSESINNCEAGPLSVRNSFVKMPKEKEYEPLLYTDTLQVKKETDYDKNGAKKLGTVRKFSGNSTGGIDVLCEKPLLEREQKRSGGGDNICEPLGFDMHKRYGFFRTENVSYAPDRLSGTEDNRLYFANRWNIWRTAFDKDGARIPLQNREPKQIVYHLNVGFPEKKFELGVRGLEEEWNRVFTETVRQALGIRALNAQSITSWIELYRGVSDRAYLRLLEDGNKGKLINDSYEDTDEVDKVLLNLAKERLGETSLEVEVVVDKYNRAMGIVGAPPAKLSNPLKADGVYKALEDYLISFRSWQRGAPIPSGIKVQERKYLQASKDPVLSVLVDLAYDRIEKVWEDAQKSGDYDDLEKITSDLETAYGNSKIKENSEDIEPLVSVPGEEGSNIWTHVEPIFDDANGDTIKGRISESNKKFGGDRAVKPEQMFSILPNSCSPKRLMQWHKEHGDLNSDVMQLFDGKTEKSFEQWIDDNEVNKLREFCAQLEWYTQEAPEEKDRFSWERIGDLRYSFINNVTSDAPWLGYGPSAADPVTGEIISGNANFAGQIVDFYAQMATDFQLIFDGRYDMDDDVLTGDFMRKKIKELNKKLEGSILDFSNLKSDADESALSLPERIQLAAQQNDSAKLDQLRAESVKQLREFAKQAPPHLLEKVQREIDHSLELTNDTIVEQSKRVEDFLNSAEVRSARLQDPMFRDALKMQAISKFGKRKFTEEELSSVYSEVAFPQLAFQRMESQARNAALQNIMTTDSLEQAVHSSISYLGSSEFFKNKPPAMIKKWFLNNVFLSTQLHEVGHTVGLRHNFIGSYDALNFSQEYWDMRVAARKEQEKSGGELMDLSYLPKGRAEELLGRPLKGGDNCDDGEGEDKLCMRNWFSEPEARETTSIMDYTPGFTNGVMGLGKYDQGAINFAYANKVEVFGSTPLPDYSRLFLRLVDYKNLPTLFANPDGAPSDTPPRSAEELELGVKRMTRSRYWVDISEAIQQRYDQLKQAADLVKTSQGEFYTSYWAPANTEVPYEFCSDEYANSRLGCSLHDWGANPEEILDYSINDFETFKNLRRYLRGRKSESMQIYRSYMGWLARTLNQAQIPFFYYQVYKNIGWDRANIGMFNSLEAASMRAFNFMVATYSQPETGLYCQYTKDNSSPGGNFTTFGALKPVDMYFPVRYFRMQAGVSACNGSDQIVIDKTQGFDYRYDFTNEYDYRMERLGSYFDKQLALNFFFRVTGSFSERVAITDERTTQAYFWTEFNDQAYNLIRGIILNDPTLFAGVVRVKDGKKVYEAPRPLERENYLFGKQHSQEGLPRVFTRSGYNEQFDALLLSLLSYSTNADSRPDVVQYLRVSVSDPTRVKVGKDEALSFGSSTVRFEDPLTAKVYTAIVPPDGRSITKDIVEELKDYIPVYKDAKDKFEKEAPGSTNYRNAKERLDNVIAAIEYYKGILERIRWIVDRAKILQ